MRTCIQCGAPLKNMDIKCEYCGTMYDYIGPPIPEEYWHIYYPDLGVVWPSSKGASGWLTIQQLRDTIGRQHG